MLKPCIICGVPVEVIGNPEIVACQSKICINTVENHIGLHYEQASPVYADYAKPGSDFTAVATFKNGNLVLIERTRTIPLSEHFSVHEFNGSIHIQNGR